MCIFLFDKIMFVLFFYIVEWMPQKLHYNLKPCREQWKTLIWLLSHPETVFYFAYHLSV